MRTNGKDRQNNAGQYWVPDQYPYALIRTTPLHVDSRGTRKEDAEGVTP